jgi:hypothetical protein
MRMDPQVQRDAIERESEQVYHRQLPGGGFVAIEVTPSRNILGRTSYRGEVVVERRSAYERRAGHVAPVIAATKGVTIEEVFDVLFPVAQSNVIIATKCLERDRSNVPGRP